MKLINDYIGDRIDEEETLDDFIWHQKNCKSCREELELYYMLHRGLEEEDLSADFNSELDEKIERQERQLDFNYNVKRLSNVAALLGEIIVFISLVAIIVRLFIV